MNHEGLALNGDTPKWRHNGEPLRMELFRLSRLLIVIASFSLLVSCTSEKDMQATKTAAARVNTQMRNKEFADIYRESSQGFKTISESDFVAHITELQKKLGPIKSISDRAYQSGVDSNVGRTHTLISDVEYETGRVRQTLVFVPGQNGAMQLWKLGFDPIQ